jgi:hypothetical protein
MVSFDPLSPLIDPIPTLTSMVNMIPHNSQSHYRKMQTMKKGLLRYHWTARSVNQERLKRDEVIKEMKMKKNEDVSVLLPALENTVDKRPLGGYKGNTSLGTYGRWLLEHHAPVLPIRTVPIVSGGNGTTTTTSTTALSMSNVELLERNRLSQKDLDLPPNPLFTNTFSRAARGDAFTSFTHPTSLPNFGTPGWNDFRLSASTAGATLAAVTRVDKSVLKHDDEELWRALSVEYNQHKSLAVRAMLSDPPKGLVGLEPLTLAPYAGAPRFSSLSSLLSSSNNGETSSETTSISMSAMKQKKAEKKEKEKEVSFVAIIRGSQDVIAQDQSKLTKEQYEARLKLRLGTVYNSGAAAGDDGAIVSGSPAPLSLSANASLPLGLQTTGTDGLVSAATAAASSALFNKNRFTSSSLSTINRFTKGGDLFRAPVIYRKAVPTKVLILSSTSTPSIQPSLPVDGQPLVLSVAERLGVEYLGPPLPYLSEMQRTSIKLGHKKIRFFETTPENEDDEEEEEEEGGGKNPNDDENEEDEGHAEDEEGGVAEEDDDNNEEEEGDGEEEEEEEEEQGDGEEDEEDEGGEEEEEEVEESDDEAGEAEADEEHDGRDANADGEHDEE